MSGDEGEALGRDTLKLQVARTIKWNVVDKVGSQILYAVTGIILAKELSQYDFGLVGAILVFQAFASLFVDSGFSFALLQRKNPTKEDYSTVLWFNLLIAICIYVVLFFIAPLIADLYEGSRELIPLSRVMFLTFIVNATSIVQTNILMKKMVVKMVAVSNSCGLFAGSVIGIWMALSGYGAWAIVAQNLTLASVRSAILWATGGWLPDITFSWRILKSYMRVGLGVAASSFLNTVFQNIYSLIIGAARGLVSLGYYTQADKWSKMGISSLSQVLTSSFLPLLSKYQDEPVEFSVVTAKTNRFTTYLLLPATGMLVMVATPLFHALFGTKWDGSIVLFQLLLLRGIFTVYSTLYNNYVIALGKAKLMIYTEILRDVTALAAILLTLPMIGESRGGDDLWGVRLFVWGQVAASAVTWVTTLIVAARLARRGWLRYITDTLPYLAVTVAAMGAMWAVAGVSDSAWITCGLELLAGGAVYFGLNAILGSKMQSDAIAFLLKRH
ncbi:MAG: lipopolysaccharide biosynthesis protein [Bacteroides sp.]|nr:lipopolysaccharide biosynthesis protein [Bacteroides sp.]